MTPTEARQKLTEAELDPALIDSAAAQIADAIAIAITYGEFEYAAQLTETASEAINAKKVGIAGQN